MKFCLTLAEPNRDALEEKIHRYAGRVEMVEIRLDQMVDPELPALPSSSTEWVATCRPGREGGAFEGEETKRLRLLHRAALAGFDWVDLEWDAKPDFDWPAHTRLIRSRHFFDQMPDDLDRAWSSLGLVNGMVGKLVPKAGSTAEAIRLLQWLESSHVEDGVVFAMGTHGQVSRYLGALGVNAWTYVAEDRGSTVAPGQFGLAEAASLRRLDTDSDLRVYGIVGNPVAHSRSPELHNHLFQANQLNHVYIPICVDDFSSWWSYLQATQVPFAGFSVTIPFKLDAARCVGAVGPVNTLTRSPRGWDAANTDLPGFLRPLKRRVQLEGAQAVVLGYGGVARTAVDALQSSGCTVAIYGRDRTKAAAVAAEYGCSSGVINEVPASADVLVNTTPVGQWPDVDSTPIDPRNGEFRVVYDLVYNPQQTRLLRLAAESGSVCISGLEMFVEQAALQFEAWTGISPPRDEIRSFLGSRD